MVDINKVLIRDGKEFVERVDREASENIAKMTPKERRQNFYQTSTIVQRLMDGAEDRKKSLEGKTFKDVETKNRFTGSYEQGKKIFDQIKDRKLVGSSTQLTIPQLRANSEISKEKQGNIVPVLVFLFLVGGPFAYFL